MAQQTSGLRCDSLRPQWTRRLTSLLMLLLLFVLLGCSEAVPGDGPLGRTERR
jgi:hypothetical protein